MQIKRGFYNLGKISNKLSTSRYTLEKYLHYKDKKILPLRIIITLITKNWLCQHNSFTCIILFYPHSKHRGEYNYFHPFPCEEIEAYKKDLKLLSIVWPNYESKYSNSWSVLSKRNTMMNHMCNFVFSSSHIYKSKMKQMHFNNIFYLIPYIQIIIIQHGISIFKTTNEIFYILFFLYLVFEIRCIFFTS